MTLSYNGSAFCGWQRQKNDPSVQGTLENALSMLLGEKIEVIGAGRTDTLVNARGYVAHFDCGQGNSEVIGGTSMSLDMLRYKLNAVLPREIAVEAIKPASDDFHARFSAVRRQYQYFIHQEKDPFRDAFSWYCRFHLDIDRMNRACTYLLGTHDCSCFEKTGSDNATSICTIMAASWRVSGDNCLTFTIEANRFLRNMVRAVVGTTVDIGRGVHEPEYILELLEKGTRSDAGQSVPGHALFLSGIFYQK